MDNPATPTGALHWVLLGLAGAMMALTVGVLAPKLIPARATRTVL